VGVHRYENDDGSGGSDNDDAQHGDQTPAN